MPYDDPDATDPMTLHGVVVETESDAAMRDMAECFVEEYIRSGFEADRILKMFQTQGYAGPFLAYQTLACHFRDKTAPVSRRRNELGSLLPFHARIFQNTARAQPAARANEFGGRSPRAPKCSRSLSILPHKVSPIHRADQAGMTSATATLAFPVRTPMTYN